LKILICEFHLQYYCTILLEDFEKIDLAIFSIDDPPATWVVHDYRVLKGGQAFEAQLAAAAADSHATRAAHLNSDISMGNVLLLLAAASQRVGRGEALSAHGFVAMASD